MQYNSSQICNTKHFGVNSYNYIVSIHIVLLENTVTVYKYYGHDLQSYKLTSVVALHSSLADPVGIL